MPGIVVGIDGSEHSHFVLEWAMRHAALRHLPLTVITVVESTIPGWAGTMVIINDGPALDLARDQANEAVAKAAALLGDEVPPSVLIQSYLGTPAEILIRESQDAELLVVGSRGAGGFARLMMGSVSTQLAHHARCPVVIIPGPREA
jgi:nucleotide-binding universal stress UspA family protein